MDRETHTIDATDKAPGRVAAEAATLLRGKHKPTFVAHRDVGDYVCVENIEHMRITGDKLDQKKYYQHSGYMGGLRETSMRELYEKKGSHEILRRAVYGMLPKNNLRERQIQRLKFEKGAKTADDGDGGGSAVTAGDNNAEES